MKTKQEELFISSPVNVSDKVKKDVFNAPDIGHREPEFQELFKEIRKKLLKYFKANSDYSIMVINGSGTAAMEVVVSSVIDNKKVPLFISNGQFGERFVEIRKVHGGKHWINLRNSWGKPIEINCVEEILKNDALIDTIFLTYHETSSGIINPVTQIGKLAKKYNKLFIVDCISAIGAENVNVVKQNIDFAIGSSSKAIGGMTVLGFVCAKKSAINKIKKYKSKTFYLDLIKHYNYAEERNQTPFTPAIPLFVSLNSALDEDLKKKKNKYQKNSRYLRDGLKRLGLKIVIPAKHRSNIVTYVYLPKGIKYKELYSKLKKKGFLIYEAKGRFKDRAFHVANAGTISKKTIKKFLSELEWISTRRF